MAELVFFTGTMDSGKSTLALQTDYNHSVRGRRGLVFTQHDRAGEARISSRLGLTKSSREVTPELDFIAVFAAEQRAGRRVDYLVCDESQFYTPAQIEQLAILVDEFDVDVFAFGITADFRTRLFPGSARLLELADRTEILQVTALCWCGAPATHNARTVGGVMVVEGDQVVIGDTGTEEGVPLPEVAYEVLCRRHHMRRETDPQKARQESLF